MTDIVEIKSLIEKQGQAWEEFKKTNDELINAKADGKAVADLEAKLQSIGADMDKLAELKSQFEEVMKTMQRPGAGGEAKAELEEECKSFNAALRADYQAKGRAIPAEVSVDTYAQYKSAFYGLMRHGDIEKLSADERKAMSAGSDPDGGFMLPPSTVGRTVKKLYDKSIMRQLATVVTLSGADLEGIVDNDEADAGWVSELGSREDTKTPQVGKYRIEAFEMYAQPKVTQKLIDDASVDVEAWLSGKVADKFARVEGRGFILGDGIEKARGLCTYATAATGDGERSWGTFQHVVTGADGAFGSGKADPVLDLIGSFHDEYLQNAQWLTRREVRTALRKMKKGSSDDTYLWEPSLQAGQPERFMGYGMRIDQNMPAMAKDSLSLAFGDFAEAYTIVDRIGIRTLRDPFTAKPYIRFYSTKRTGGGAVNFEAVKFLKFSAA